MLVLVENHSLPRDRRLLRPRQDGHREVEHAGLQPVLLPRRSDQPSGRAAHRLRPVRLSSLGGADHDQMERMRKYLSALCRGWNVQQVREIVAETLHDLIDPIIYDEAASLIEEHHAAGRDVVIVSTSGRRGRRADRRAARRRPRHRHPDGGRRTAATPARSSTTRTAETKAEAISELAESEGYDLSRCYAYSDSVTDLPMLESVGHPLRGQPGPGAAPGGGRPRLAGARLQPPGAAAASGCPTLPMPPGAGSSPRPRWARRRPPPDWSGTLAATPAEPRDADHRP